MDLSFTPAELAFREEVRHFFRTEIPEKIRDKVLEGRHLTKDEIITSQRILNARGWAVPNWPKEWGGQGWSPPAGATMRWRVFSERSSSIPTAPPRTTISATCCAR